MIDKMLLMVLTDDNIKGHLDWNLIQDKDLVIVVADTHFKILKNRWGVLDKTIEYPLHLLRKVILNPKGKLTTNWE